VDVEPGRRIVLLNCFGLENARASLTVSRVARRRNTVRIKVPASTSNLGSGFDTLGLAVTLYNRVRVTTSEKTGVKIASHIAEEDRAAAASVVEKAAGEFFCRAGQTAFGIEVHWEGDIPVARGLGYSATARLGVIAGLNELAGSKWNRQQLLELVTALEGHPDNASPAIFGGFTVSGMVGPTVRCLRFRVSSKLRLVTLIPHFKVSTEKARSFLPEILPRVDAVHALNRAAIITAAFAYEDYEALRGLFDDRVHQPYREPLIPQMSRVIRAGETAGALGGFLSGSGSAVICLALQQPEAVAAAMQQELPDSETKILAVDNHGFEIE